MFDIAKYLSNFVLAIGLSAGAASADEQYISSAPEPVPVDLTTLELDSIILDDIPAGNVVVEAFEHQEAKLDRAHLSDTGQVRYTLTDNRYTSVITAPSEYANIPNLSDAFQCGVNIAIIENDQNLYKIPQPYASESRTDSDPLHRVTVSHYSADALELGINFLESSSITDCWNIGGSEGRLKILSAMQGGLGPILIR